MFNPKFKNTRSQDVKKSFHDVGQFYLCKSSVIRKKKFIKFKFKNYSFTKVQIN